MRRGYIQQCWLVLASYCAVNNQEICNMGESPVLIQQHRSFQYLSKANYVPQEVWGSWLVSYAAHLREKDCSIRQGWRRRRPGLRKIADKHVTVVFKTPLCCCWGGGRYVPCFWGNDNEKLCCQPL